MADTKTVNNMKTIKEVIEETVTTGKRILAENNGLQSLNFEFLDFSIEDVREAAKTYATSGKAAEFYKFNSRMGFLYFDTGNIYIYICSVKVQIKEHLVITEAMVNV